MIAKRAKKAKKARKAQTSFLGLMLTTFILVFLILLFFIASFFVPGKKTTIKLGERLTEKNLNYFLLHNITGSSLDSIYKCVLNKESCSAELDKLNRLEINFLNIEKIATIEAMQEEELLLPFTESKVILVKVREK